MAKLGRFLAGVAVLSGVLAGGGASAQEALRPDQVAFRALYKELVETDTSITTGSCTLLADRIEKHLREAGYGDADITRFAVAEHPKEGGIVVVLPGTSKTLKPILLLGHLDVVVAKREDWTRDPYQFIEEGGYFYGRGTSDMKAMDAIWIDLMMRAKKDGTKFKRKLKLALTCGEETSWAFNGAKWLTENKRELIDAEFALNEGGGGRTSGPGTPIAVASLHVGEKNPVNYRIEATNVGGHSSIPIRDNAIYELADDDRHHAGLFRQIGRGAGRCHEQGDGGDCRQSRRPSGRVCVEHRQVVSFDVAHHLRGDFARWGPCQ